MATCPECEYDEVNTDDMEEGDTISCPECGKSLVVTGADEVDLADEDDDLDDEDEEEEEEEEEDDDDLDDDDEDVDEEEDVDE
jgi:transcription elongation factor Elf1